MGHLRFVPAVAWLAVITLSGSLFLTYMMVVEEGGSPLWGAIMAPFVLIGLYLLAESVWGRVVFSARGFESRTPLRGTCNVTWKEVERVRYDRHNSWWIIDSKRSRRVRVSFLMAGVGDFSRTMKEHVAKTAFESKPFGLGL